MEWNIRTNVGCYDFCHPKDESLMIHIESPILTKPVNIHLPEYSRYNYSEDDPWVDWLADAIKEWLGRIWIATDKPAIQSLYDYIKTEKGENELGLAYWKKRVPFLVKRSEAILHQLDMAKKKLSEYENYVQEDQATEL